ncbi:MAG: histidine phosphatase family protein [Microscillaceae bacterium]|nr:histidine phosphatase family protein [Microscillaceae bacterium]
MKNKYLYLIRHGQTEFNKQNIVQGSGIDAGLNELGYRQAQAFYEAYRHIPFDKVYTSKLKRTQETVANFIADGIPHEAFEGLNEINWGKKEGRAITAEDDAYYFFMLSEWARGNTDLAIEGGESPRQVSERQNPVLDLILSRPEEEHVLICMHGRAMRIFLCLMLRYDIKEMERFEHSNVCLYQLTHTGSMFTIDRYFDIAHLEGLEA